MAGVAYANVIDVIAQDASGRFVVIMVESRMWGADEAQASQLQDKINSYAGFIADGRLAMQCPETAGQPVDIQLNCVDAPRGQFATIVEHARTQLGRIGIGFRVKVAPNHQ
jgi:hypothetical protein